MKKKRIMFWFLVLGLTFLVSCAGKAEKPEKIKDLEYTVQKEGELPEELLSKIREKQKEPFRLTYVTDGYLYIAKGYGIQETSGYSIQITELYEAAEGVVFCTELIGPAKEEPVLKVETYPYIVVKLKDLGLDILFH